jgi:hypothetical protein
MQVCQTYKNSEFGVCSLEWIQSNVETPHFQRYKSEDRISEVVIELSKTKEPTGVLILCKFKSKCYIIDGQHRLEGYKRLDISPIPVQIIQVQTEEQMFDLFANINKMVPVEEYVIMAKNHPERKRKFEKLFEYIENNYAIYKSNSLESFRFPSISLFEMKKLNVISRFPFVEGSTFENIIQKFENFNLDCKSQLTKEDIEKCEKKKVKNGKYLYISKYLRNTMKENLSEGDSRMIDENLRKSVWNKRNGKVIEGKCFCCEKPITYGTFECGHIVAYANNGRTELSNLEPICKSCNVRSGKRNLLDYKKQISSI